MNRCIKVKYISLLVIIMLCFLMIGCKKEDLPLDDEGLYIPEVLQGEHTILEKDLDIYLLVQGKPAPELKYSITIFSDFKKENRTSRHYSYYQVDYITRDNVLEHHYHFFDYVTDGTQRSYAQKLLPYNKLSDLLDQIKVKFEYSFMIDDVVYEEECVFSEQMLLFDDKKTYLNIIDEYQVTINSVVDEDGNNRYKLNLVINDYKQKQGHLDFTAFVKFNDGLIYPLYGLYHYNFARGNYLSASDTIVAGNFAIEEVYYVFKEYLTDGTVNYIYYKN